MTVDKHKDTSLNEKDNKPLVAYIRRTRSCLQQQRLPDRGE